MSRTYLYVDGENFAQRAARLYEELSRNQEQAARLRNLANSGGNMEDMHAQDSLTVWRPEPHRSAVNDPRTENGLLYTNGEVYWDSLGLYIALTANLLTVRAHSQVNIDRAYYFASAASERIKQHERDLHAIGFVPFVSRRMKRDNWVKDMAAQGITVISRPKPMDIQLAVQVLEDCTADNFDRCIFVGGDEDYVPLLEAVRRHGKEVWLVAIERWLTERLRFACDRFVAYDPVLSVRPLPPSPVASDVAPPLEEDPAPENGP